MTSAIRPVLQSLLVADHVYTDAGTGKKIIAGVFQQLFFYSKSSIEQASQLKHVQAGGYQSGSPFAYASLTDVLGEQKFELRYVCLRNEAVVFTIGFDLACHDRLQNVELSLPLPPLPTEPPGVYALELLWNSEPLGSYRIVVKQIGNDDRKNDDDTTT